MSDITMCKGDNCPQKASCLRFTAEVNPKWQSWSSFRAEGDSGKCKSFVPNSKEMKE